MKRVETYRWRTLWLGKWTTTRHHASEADIRIEHPEAVALPETLIVREVPETEEEFAEQQRSMSLGNTAGPRHGGG